MADKFIVLIEGIPHGKTFFPTIEEAEAEMKRRAGEIPGQVITVARVLRRVVGEVVMQEIREE